MRQGKFRTHLAQRRCIIPEAGFYEWREEGDKQPYFFHGKDGQALMLAGIWDEAFAFLRAGGISGAETKAALLDRLMPTVLAGYAQRMADQPEILRPAGSLIGRKDNALALDAAKHMSIDLPLARLIANLC